MPQNEAALIPLRVFTQCVQAIADGAMITRASSSDKEFHFQNWFRARLQEVGEHFELGGRNSYPDFRMVEHIDGFEIKGLAYPGREANFDSNSQVPTGLHNGRTIYYVFGRYPKVPDGEAYPVLDLAICHGDFLNADHNFRHKNKNVKGFGTYGDIMIRDRKMYVVPTPFRVADGLAHRQTLILPSQMRPQGLAPVGDLFRRECARVVVGYAFDLRTNEIVPQLIDNPSAGREHHFTAWRVSGAPAGAVSMKNLAARKVEVADDESADENK